MLAIILVVTILWALVCIALELAALWVDALSRKVKPLKEKLARMEDAYEYELKRCRRLDDELTDAVARLRTLGGKTARQERLDLMTRQDLVNNQFFTWREGG